MTQDIDNHSEDWALAAEYTLGLLSDQEAKAFEDALAQDPELRSDYADWAETFASLTDDTPPVAPPADMWGRISARAFGREKKQSFFGRLGIMSALGGGLIGPVAV